MIVDAEAVVASAVFWFGKGSFELILRLGVSETSGLAEGSVELDLRDGQGWRVGLARENWEPVVGVLVGR